MATEAINSKFCSTMYKRLLPGGPRPTTEICFKPLRRNSGRWSAVEYTVWVTDRAHSLTLLRIPYWDWAAAPPGGESVLPLSVGVEYVVVSGPNGNQTISNPLFSYSFKPLDTTAFHLAPWNQWTTTLRSPTPPRSPSAQSNNSAIAANLDVAQSSFQARVYNLFSTYENYSQFTTEIESLHNDVHAVSGGLNGHMYFIPFSAFDPLFFIHHAMVDRLFALWQVLNPNSWLVPSAAAVASATTFKGEIEDGSTGLAPFIAGSNGSLWSSDMIRDPGIFG